MRHKWILLLLLILVAPGVFAHQLKTPADSDDSVRLSPKIIKQPLHNVIQPVNLADLKPFLNDSEILQEDYLATAPYVVGYSGEHIVGGNNEYIYVNGLLNPHGKSYRIFRDGGPYLDPFTHEILGFDAIYVADAQLEQLGNPATLLVTKSSREIRPGDKVLPAPPNALKPYYNPQPPKHHIDGAILRLLGNINQAGDEQVAVISRGQRDGVRVGDMLHIYEHQQLVEDPLIPGQYERLPSEQEGKLMIYRVFDRLSFGLIVEANSVIHIHDVVTYP